MALVNYLQTIGKNSDYSSRKNLYESMGLQNKYGIYQGTSQQNIAFENTLKGQPSPQKVDSSIKQPTPQAPTTAMALQPMGGGANQDLLAGYNLSKFTPMQQQYLQTIATAPTETQLRQQFAQETGAQAQRDIVAGLDKQIINLEQTLSKIEPAITEKIKGFDVTEAQRQLKVSREEQPIRQQYQELLAAKQREEATLRAREAGLSEAVAATLSPYERQAMLLEKMMGFEDTSKKGSDLDLVISSLSSILGGQQEEVTQPEISPELTSLTDELLSDIDASSAKLAPSAKNNKWFIDKWLTGRK